MWNNARLLTKPLTASLPVSPTQLLIVYCLGIAGFSLIGGLLPGWIKMTHTRTQLVMSLVSGLMLGFGENQVECVFSDLHQFF